jgi:hypothetical protein
MVRRSETWKKYGQVEVTRDEKRRFIHWQKILPVAKGKAVAVYGTFITQDGKDSRRYEFYDGTGRETYQSVLLAHEYPPKRRFVSVSAKKFLANPFKYATKGYWIDFEVAS